MLGRARRSERRLKRHIAQVRERQNAKIVRVTEHRGDGDWHLGQLGRRSATAPWLLIDVDDLGVGDPAWDLARPAGFWAAGLIPDDEWTVFLEAYRDADGPALALGDPWPVLEPFARAAVVQAAANHPDDELLIAACARMG